MLFLYGVYVSGFENRPVFKQVNAPTKDQLQALVQCISERLAKLLTRKGLLAQDAENAYLTLDALEDQRGQSELDSTPDQITLTPLIPLIPLIPLSCPHSHARRTQREMQW
jgi:hypothetical protein